MKTVKKPLSRKQAEDLSKPLTEGKFQYYFESLKDLMHSSTTGLKGEIAELKTDVAELKTDVAELKTDVAELKIDVKELKQDVGLLKVAVSEHTRLIKRLDTKIDTIHARDTARIDNHETRIVALE